MRSGLTSAWTAALEDMGIRTAIVARFDFQSETIFAWTGSYPIAVSGTGDPLMDGATFDPLVAGVMVEIGENAYSYSGSEALTLKLAIPASPHSAIAAAAVLPDEYQGRTATLWRALMIEPPSGSTGPVWGFRRIRAGSMDTVAISNDGNAHYFRLTIESHASLISNATGSTYLDQKLIDAADTSQDFAVSIANGQPAPSSGSAGGYGYEGTGSGRPANPDRQYTQYL